MKPFAIENITRKSVLEMIPYSSARDEFNGFKSDLIFLDANENPFNNGLNRYPDSTQLRLKSEFARLRSVADDNILLGNGSDELLDLIFRAFCEPNIDSIISLPPTYGMYGVLSAVNAVKNWEVPLTNEFQPDVQSIISAIDSSTKVIFLCSPNNPTGNAFSAEKILKILTEFSGLVVIDEAYIDFSQQKSWIEKLAEFPNLIILQTMSKAFGMAGIRLGVLYANPSIIRILTKIKPPYNINTLTQQRALERLSDMAQIRFEIDQIIQNRNFITSELLKIPFVEKVYPSDANFVLIKVDDASFRYKQLIASGIVVRNRSHEIENCLRITVGTTDQNSNLIQTLKKL